MSSRQSMSQQWFLIDREPDERAWIAMRKLQPETGLLLLCRTSRKDRRRLLHLRRLRNLKIVTERPGVAARVHNVPELRTALLQRTPLVLLSPLYPTLSHSDWRPLPLMRAAALARLAQRRLVALGGMNARRYAKIAPLGFIGWAGISAFRT